MSRADKEEAEEVFEDGHEHLGEEEFDMSKIASAELGNTSKGFKHEILKEKPESSQVESHEDLELDEDSEDLEKEEDMAEGISLTVMRQDTWSWLTRSWS